MDSMRSAYLTRASALEMPILWQACKCVKSDNGRLRQPLRNHSQRLAEVDAEFKHESVFEMRREAVKRKLEEAVRAATT